MKKVAKKTLENLTIQNYMRPYYYTKYEVFAELDPHLTRVLYSLEGHKMFLVAKNATEPYYVNYENQFKESYPDWEPASEELLDELKKKARVVFEQAQKQKKTRDFYARILKHSVSTDVLSVRAYLDGATEGGGNVKITDDLLRYWNYPLARRAGVDEYLLSSSMSGGGTNNCSCEVRVLATMVAAGVKLWPSLLDYQTNRGTDTDGELVVGWCQQQLMFVQVKWMNAKKYKPAYEALRKQVIVTYHEACERWRGEIDDTLIEDVDAIIKIFGDRPTMKEYNAALRLQYEMGGF